MILQVVFRDACEWRSSSIGLVSKVQILEKLAMVWVKNDFNYRFVSMVQKKNYTISATWRNTKGVLGIRAIFKIQDQFSERVEPNHFWGYGTLWWLSVTFAHEKHQSPRQTRDERVVPDTLWFTLLSYALFFLPFYTCAKIKSFYFGKGIWKKREMIQKWKRIMNHNVPDPAHLNHKVEALLICFLTWSEVLAVTAPGFSSRGCNTKRWEKEREKEEKNMVGLKKGGNGRIEKTRFLRGRVCVASVGAHYLPEWLGSAVDKRGRCNFDEIADHPCDKQWRRSTTLSEHDEIGVESRSPPPASRRLRLAGRSLPGQQQLLAQAHKPPHAFRRISFTFISLHFSRIQGMLSWIMFPILWILNASFLDLLLMRWNFFCASKWDF